MKQKFISQSLVFLVIISCSATNENSENNLETYIESTTTSSSLVEDIGTSSTTTIIPAQLDKTYRNGKNFTLPTFNGNCPHKPDEILNLFNYWIEEFDLNISFDIVGEPVFGSGSKLQLENVLIKLLEAI